MLVLVPSILGRSNPVPSTNLSYSWCCLLGKTVDGLLPSDSSVTSFLKCCECPIEINIFF